jgi:hypothetical protein
VALYVPAPSMAGYGEQQIIRTLPEFCFRWLKLLGVGLAVAFAIQALASAPVPSAVGVPLIFTALKTIATAMVEVGAQLGPLLVQLAGLAFSNWMLSLPGLLWAGLYWILFQLARWTPLPMAPTYDLQRPRSSRTRRPFFGRQAPRRPAPCCCRPPPRLRRAPALRGRLHASRLSQAVPIQASRPLFLSDVSLRGCSAPIQPEDSSRTRRTCSPAAP